MPDILPLLLRLQPVLPLTVCRQLYRIVMAMWVMPAHITQLGLARWAETGGSYRTVHRFFHTDIDWLQVKWLFFVLFLYTTSDTYLLVGDETVLKKAGKHTFGIDRFFSSLADKAVPGVAFFVLALVSVQKRHAYPLCAEQVVRSPEEKQQARQARQAKQAKAQVQDTASPAATPRKAGRPKGSPNKNKADVTLTPELTRILGWTQKVFACVGKTLTLHYFVLDGHFGNHPAHQMARQLQLHLISRLRHNAALYLLPSEAQHLAHPRQKYGDKLDYDALPLALRVSCTEEDGYRSEVYQMRCRHKDFADALNIVVLVKTHLASGRRGHVVLMSSDLTLDAPTLVDYYALRFQIEFAFRDAKQHFGLTDFRCVSQVAVKNTVGLAFFMGNLSTHLLGALREPFPDAGIADLKSYYRGRRYVRETLKCLPDFADDIVGARVLEQVSRLGFIHAGVKQVPRAPSGGKSRVSEDNETLDRAA